MKKIISSTQAFLEKNFKNPHSEEPLQFTEDQASWLEGGLLAVHRRGGSSLVTTHAALEMLFSTPGSSVLVITSTYSVAESYDSQFEAIFKHNNLDEFINSKTKRPFVWRFKNGSVLRLITWGVNETAQNNTSLCGQSADMIIVPDCESFGDRYPECIKALKPILEGNCYQIRKPKLITTGQQSLLNYRSLLSQYPFFNYPISKNPQVSKERQELIKNKCDALTWFREFEW